MDDKIRVRRQADGSYGLFRGERGLLLGLSREDVADLRACGMLTAEREPSETMERRPSARGADQGFGRPTARRFETRGVGRPLMLEAHVDLIRTLVRERPGITPADIKGELSRRGIVVTTTIPIRNLLRRHDLPSRQSA